MTGKPYGKYDDLTPDERETLRIKTFVEMLLCGAAVFVLFAVDRYLGPFGWFVDAVVVVLTLGVMLRWIVLLIRTIGIVSPNPRRKPTDEPPVTGDK